MTSVAPQPNDKWFTVYVPHSDATAASEGQAATPITYESYIRLGSPDRVTEDRFVTGLRADFDRAGAEPAVAAAFGQATPTGGIVMYTEGDLCQFVNGKSDTRVLNDSYLVHVLNQDGVAAADADSTLTTCRSYLRLGKPSADVEIPNRDNVAEGSYTLGYGVALYSDKGVTVTTPDKYKVTVGKDSRTVLGETYVETYDVSDDQIARIRNGEVDSSEKLTNKRLITATLTKKEASKASWRTTKFDQAKALTYSCNDLGVYSLSSAYNFAFGLKLNNAVAASFDATQGIAVSAPLSFKVEYGQKRMETSWSFGKCKFESEQDIRGETIKLVADPAAAVVNKGFTLLSKVVSRGMIAINAATAAYLASVVAIGNTTTQDTTEGTNIKEMLEAGEAVYIASTALNAIFLALSVIAGAIQLGAKKGSDALNIASPVQPPNILMNSAGIKLQNGASYIELTQTGVVIHGIEVKMVGPMTNIEPMYLLGNRTPTAIAELTQYIQTAGLDPAQY